MSFFFFIITTLTYFFSHFWARRTVPVTPSSFTWTKKLSGDLKTFHKKIENFVSQHPELLILEKTNNSYLISESPSLFEYGNYYHFHCKEFGNNLVVKMQVQPKLVNPNTKKVKSFFDQIEGLDAG